MGFHGLSDSAHGLVAGEENEGAGEAFVSEVSDPFFEGFFVAGIFGFRHLADEVELHLAFVVKRAADLEGRDFLGADALAEVGEIRGSNGERGAGENGASSFAEEETAKGIGEIDGGGAEGAELLSASALLDPIDLIGLVDAEEIGNRGACAAELAGGVLEFGCARFVFAFRGLGADEFAEFGEGGADIAAIDEAGFADAAFASALERALEGDLVEKTVRRREHLGDRFAGRAIFEGLKEAFFRSRIVEPLHHAAKSELGDFHADVAGGNLLDGVGLVENHEIVGKEESAGAIFRIIDGAEECEKKRVIEDDDMSLANAAAEGLVMAPRGWAACLWCAEVLLAADFVPDEGIGLFEEIAERTVFCREAPFANTLEFAALIGGEKIGGLVEGAGEAGGAEEVLSALQENGFELVRDELLNQRNVFVDELLLKRDRVRGDDCLAF